MVIRTKRKLHFYFLIALFIVLLSVSVMVGGVDASAESVVFYFDDYDPDVDWDYFDFGSYDALMSDGDWTTVCWSDYRYEGDTHWLTGNSWSDESLGEIVAVELRAYGMWSDFEGDAILRPYFNGEDFGDNHYCDFLNGTYKYSNWSDITYDTNAPDTWTWDDIGSLECYVISTGNNTSVGVDIGSWIGISIVEIRVSYNNAPTQSGEVPVSGSTGISPTPSMYVFCTDADNDNLNATWWSNSSGSWVQFASNLTSFANNTNITQTNSNFSVLGTTYWWSVNLTDGTDWCNDTYHFTTLREGGNGGGGVKNSILFYVYDTSGQPVINAVIQIYEHSDIIDIGYTDLDGLYETSLYDGEYIIYIHTSGHNTVENIVVTGNEIFIFIVNKDYTPFVITIIIIGVSIALLILLYFFYTRKE